MSCDDMDRLISLSQTNRAGGHAVAPKLATFSYDAASQLTDLKRYSSLSGGTGNLEVHSRFGYDLAGRLTSVTHGKAEIAPGQTWDGTSSVPASLGATNMLAAYFLTYDKDNRVTSFASYRDGMTTNYVYDGNNNGNGGNSTDQLKSASTVQIPGLSMPFAPPAETFNYDANGNRRSASGQSQSASGTHNRLQTDGVYNYAYDNEGNQISRTRISDGQFTSYSWDFRNRLTMVTEKVSENGATTNRVEFLYDAFNQRTGKRLDTDGNGTWDRFEIFVWTDGHEMMRFIDSDGQQSSEPYRLANRYLWGPMVDQILADEQFTPGTGPLFNATTGSSTSGTTLWTLSDHLGSVRDLVDNNGVIRKHRVYSSFGQIINEVNYNASGQVISNTDPAAVDAVFAYTARALDPDLQSQTHRNRWYTPTTSRWLSQDPISFAGGDPNLYRYVRNAPTNRIDPEGLEDWLMPWDPKASWNPLRTLRFWFSHTPEEHLRGLYTCDTVEKPSTGEALEAAGQSYIENAGNAHAALEVLGRFDRIGFADGASALLSSFEGDDLHKLVMENVDPRLADLNESLALLDLVPSRKKASKSLGAKRPSGEPLKPSCGTTKGIGKNPDELPTTNAPKGPLGRGSTANLSKGTTLPRNLREQLAIEEVISNPRAGSQLPIPMTDTRWPGADGWVKMQKFVESGGREGRINVHYVLNTITGEIDDFKIVLPGTR